MMQQTHTGRKSESNDLNLEDVMERFQPALMQYATRVINNETAAQDVVQEVFIRLHANRDVVIGREAGLKTWLFRTAHNAWVDHIRKQPRRRLMNPRHAMHTEWIASAHELGRVKNEQHALVLKSLNTLRPGEREVLVLRLQEEMSFKEIASVIQRPEGVVASLIQAATDKLGQRLQQAGVIS